MHLASGRRCTGTGTHIWAKVTFCCACFDRFMAGIFDLNDAVATSRHEDLLRTLSELIGKAKQLALEKDKK